MSTRESTRTRLLDATDELLFAVGDVNAPVDRILELARASPATLYRAYGSKEALIAAALDRRHREWLEVWDAAVARAATDRARLLALFDALEEYQARPDGARWCAFLGTAAVHVDPPTVLAAAVQQDTDALRQRLGRLAVPVVGPAASTGVVEALTLIYSGHLAMRLRQVSPHAPPTTARHLAELTVAHAERARS